MDVNVNLTIGATPELLKAIDPDGAAAAAPAAEAPAEAAPVVAEPAAGAQMPTA